MISPPQRAEIRDSNGGNAKGRGCRGHAKNATVTDVGLNVVTGNGVVLSEDTVVAG